MPTDIACHVNSMAHMKQTVPNCVATGRGTKRQIMTKKSKSLRGYQQQPLEIPKK